MATMKNRVTLIGNLGKDPELNTTGAGKQYVRLAVATNESYKDRDGNRQKVTDWHDCIAWDKTAEIIEKYFKKGDTIMIEGRLKHQIKETDAGKRKYTSVVIDSFEFPVGGNNNSGGNDNSASSGKQEPEEDDDDLPF